MIEADVSTALLSSAERIQQVLHRWGQARGDSLELVEVDADAVARERRGSASGAFFSLGVDSFYTVLRNLKRYPAGDSRLISHLILVHGFDIALERTALFELVRGYALEAAAALGKKLIQIETNARAIVKSVDWGHYGCGPAMAGVGLALASVLHTVFIGASDTYEKLSPWGSHPAVDLLWSTEGLEFVYDGGELERFDKIGFVGASPVALRALRVCWENRSGLYNCGRCEKCLRTMVALRLWGALDTTGSFPRPLDTVAIAQLVLRAPVRPWWEEMLQRARTTGMDPVLISALERAVSRGVWAESGFGRGDRMLGSGFSRIGLTPERLKRFDARWLNGLGVASLRWLEQRVVRGGRI